MTQQTQPPAGARGTAAATGARSPARSLPAGIWALGVGSLLMDASSELIHGVLPLFMVTTLGASMVTVGVIEGVAEATAAILKVFSGALSDRLGRRKLVMVSGYALSALTKPIFPLAGSVGWVFAARFLDRVGKGIRGAPRDALIADIVPPPMRGAAYGLRQALDSIGALIGPLLAMALLIRFADDLTLVMWFAVAPGAAAVAVLLVMVREPERRAGDGARRATVTFGDVRRLPRAFWLVVGLGAAFTLARFSEAFLVLRARDVGLALRYAPAVMAVMSACYAAAAYPAGAAADRMQPRTVLLAGLGILIAADAVLAWAASAPAVFAGAALWGVHMGVTQGLLSKLVANTAPAPLLGTGFGIFHMVSGGALLAASVVAGGLWSRFGPAATFQAGAVFAAVAALGVLTSRHRHS